MKHILITTIVAVLLVGCGSERKHSGLYTLEIDGRSLSVELKSDNSFIGTPSGQEDDRGIGTWKEAGDLLICEGKAEKSSKKITLKINKNTLKLIALTVDEIDRLPSVPEGEEGHFFEKSTSANNSDPESVIENSISLNIQNDSSLLKAPIKEIVSDSNIISKFWFAYPYQPEPGYRLWENIDEGIWTETYPSGFKSFFNEISRINVDEQDGFYAMKVSGDSEKTQTDDGNFRVFIPDFIDAETFLYMSRKSGYNWQEWEKSNYLIKVITTRDGQKHGTVHGAVITKNIEAVSEFITDGVDLNAKDEDGKTPFDYADDEIAKLIRENGGKSGEELIINQRMLTSAARDGKIDEVKKYLTQGVDINATDEDGNTTLHWKIEKQVAEILIANGANVNAVNEHGRTPLDFSIMRDQTAVTSLLHKHGGKMGEELKVDAWGPMPTEDEVANWPFLKTKTYKKELSPKSLNSQTSVFLLFQNNLNLDIDMIWLDFDGKPQSYGIIKAGESTVMPTFSTHPWLLKDKLTEEIIGFYVTPEYSARIKLDSKTSEELKAEQK